MDDGFIRRIHQLIRDSGGQSALARKSGLSLGAIQRYMKGGEPTRGAIIRLSEACGVPLLWLVSGEEGDTPRYADRVREISVSGFAECGLQGWYNEVRYRISTSLDWPDPDLFAVIAAGHSMAPEGIRPGYICIVSPNTRPQKGDAVLIRRTDGAVTIKLYHHEDQDWLYVTGWLDPEKPGATQMLFSDQFRRSGIECLAPVVLIKRRT